MYPYVSYYIQLQWVDQQYNDPKHTSKLATNGFKTKKISYGLSSTSILSNIFGLMVKKSCKTGKTMEGMKMNCGTLSSQHGTPLL